VEFENAQVRVLRVVKDIFPDGKTSERQFKAGQATWRDAVKHTNENLSDKPVESILVELKAKQAAAKAPAKKKE
jgi:hypothetical protein